MAGAVRADLEEVFRRDYRLVVAVAARVLGAQDEAEDVAQEVFLSFGRSSVPAGEARGWLSVAAAHAALNVIRSSRRRASRERTTADPGVVGDVDAAWLRLSAAPAAGRTPRQRPATVTLLRRPAAAAVAVAVVLTGAGTAAANDWLQVFRTEQVVAVSLSTDDLLQLPDLSAYGDLRLSGDPDVREVADAAAAARESGLVVPEVADLPRGVTGDPEYQVGDQVTATFVFSAERAAAAAGADASAPPPGLDGSAVRLVAGPGVAQVWQSSSGVPALLVARAVAPTAFSSGVPFEVVRDHLLSLPGLPADVAAQLRTFAADGSVLPLPVPADQVTTSRTQVDGAPATVLRTRDRNLSAVVWVRDGVLTAVAGSLDPDEVLAVARGLR